MLEIIDQLLNPMIPLALICWAIGIVLLVCAVFFMLEMICFAIDCVLDKFKEKKDEPRS